MDIIQIPDIYVSNLMCYTRKNMQVTISLLLQTKGDNAINTTYVYRKHLRQPLKNFLLAGVLFMVFVILLSAGIILTNLGPLYPDFIRVFTVIFLCISIVVLLEVLLMYALFFRRFRCISVTLDEQGIVYTNIKEQIFIPYEDIRKIQFSSVKYMGGWSKIVYGNGNIRLTVILENIGEFMARLKQKLDERNMKEVYNEKRYFSFYKTGIFSDESWGRIYGNLHKLVLTCLTCAVITIMTLVFQGGSEYNGMLMYATLVVPVLGYVISEIILGYLVHKRVVEDCYELLPRNEKLEKNIFMICNFGFAIIYLLILFASVIM